ncbi:hypothetical protein C8A05DRAFT_39492, partial [Staphylotrichum tortipilum]
MSDFPIVDEDPMVDDPIDDDGPAVYVVMADWEPKHARKMMLQERYDAMAAAHKLMRAKYDAGVPFYTRDLIRSVVEQLDDGRNKTVAVTGLDGLDVRFTIDTGKPYSPGFAPGENKI